MEVCGINSNVICKPHPISGGLKGEVSNGFAFVKQKTDIVALEVLFESLVDEPNRPQMRIPKGFTVYVKEERIMTNLWGKQILKLEGQDVILVPATEVVAIKGVE